MDVRTFDDYYPFGSVAQSGGTTYRYEYQGASAEKDDVTGFNNFELRMYDGKIGRWLSTDPAGQYYSPYEGMGNNPVSGVDKDGSTDVYDPDGNLIRHIEDGSDANIQDNGDKTWKMINETTGDDINFQTVHDYFNPGNRELSDVNINSTPLVKNANQGPSTDQELAIFGAAASSTEHLSGITRIGSNLALYTATEKGGVFFGNQFVKTLSISKIGKIAGIGGAVLGTGLDIYGVYKGTTTIGQASENAFFTGVGLYGGPVGAGISVVYFGLNAFYPGGANQAAGDFLNGVSNANQIRSQIKMEAGGL